MIPPILFSLIISFNSIISFSDEVLTIVLNGVAINCFSSHIETPILLEPRSNPITVSYTHLTLPTKRIV